MRRVEVSGLQVVLELQGVNATVQARQAQYLVGVTGPKSKYHAVPAGTRVLPGEGQPRALCLRFVSEYDPTLAFDRIKDNPQIACDRCVGIIDGRRQRPQREDLLIVQIR